MAGVAVVTGAGRGIGRAIALRLARDGWAVGLLDVQGHRRPRARRSWSPLGRVPSGWRRT